MPGHPHISHLNRGINLAIVDPLTHEVIYKGAFDLHGDPQSNERLIQALNTAEEDYHLVVMVVSDEATHNRSEDAVRAVNQFGATEFQNLGDREPWAFIGQKKRNLPQVIKNEMSNVSGAKSKAIAYLLN